MSVFMAKSSPPLPVSQPGVPAPVNPAGSSNGLGADQTINPSEAVEAAAKVSQSDPSRFLNRELSWLAFNRRVVDESQNPAHPLLERLRFLTISASNLDEFYMVRVARLKKQAAMAITTRTADGMTAAEQLAAITKVVNGLTRDQQRIWTSLRQEMANNGITVVALNDLTFTERSWLNGHFRDHLFPVLTPLVVEPAHPFPFIHSKSLALALRLHNPHCKEVMEAVVPMPGQIERFVRLPGNTARFVLLEHVIINHINALFPNFTLIDQGVFRVIRDSELELDEDADDLIDTFESALKRRRRAMAIHLAVSQQMSPALMDFLCMKIGVGAEDVFPQDNLVGLTDARQLIINDRPDLLFKNYNPIFPERLHDLDDNCFAAIRSKDIMIHHPFESFDVVLKFLSQAARDPSVIAIKQTLYRTSHNSPVVAALIEAAEAGKSVTAVIELRARFDEEENIHSARELERSGVQVVYGPSDLKIHTKASLVLRKEGKKLCGYVHFGTGNYNPLTAKIYTDLSFFTCDTTIVYDTILAFNFMTTHAQPPNFMRLAVAPLNLRQTIIQLIDEEIAHAEAGRPATIWIKLNQLTDPDIIDKLYEASSKKVNIHCIVRGICCLRPGVDGLSENIRVKSIVGRFLEHSRIIAFGNGHLLPSRRAKVFLSSGDWMQRNLDRRIEIMSPITDKTIHKQLLDQIMVPCIRDDVQSWSLMADGRYRRVKTGRRPFSAHDFMLDNPGLSGLRSSGRRKQPEEPR